MIKYLLICININGKACNNMVCITFTSFHISSSDIVISSHIVHWCCCFITYSFVLQSIFSHFTVIVFLSLLQWRFIALFRNSIQFQNTAFISIILIQSLFWNQSLILKSTRQHNHNKNRNGAYFWRCSLWRELKFTTDQRVNSCCCRSAVRSLSKLV